MVALKRAFDVDEANFIYMKQERRGGIETRPGNRAKRPRIPKQERRGGIETHGRSPLDPPDPDEAGTPWWH